MVHAEAGIQSGGPHRKGDVELQNKVELQGINQWLSTAKLA